MSVWINIAHFLDAVVSSITKKSEAAFVCQHRPQRPPQIAMMKKFTNLFQSHLNHPRTRGCVPHPYKSCAADPVKIQQIYHAPKIIDKIPQTVVKQLNLSCIQFLTNLVIIPAPGQSHRKPGPWRGPWKQERDLRTASDPWLDVCILPKPTLLTVSFFVFYITQRSLTSIRKSRVN